MITITMNRDDFEEDLQIHKISCCEEQRQANCTITSALMSNEDMSIHNVTTTLRSELAALQYKRDHLLNELTDVRSQLKNKEQRVIELQNETEQLKEQSARQNSVITSFKNRVHELEERERSLNNALTRTEISMETLIRENRCQSEKIKEIEMKMNHLDIERINEEQNKKFTQRSMTDVVKCLASALGSELTDYASVETVTHKASELIQDVSMLQSKNFNLTDTLTAVEVELHLCRDQLDRLLAEKDNIKRQTTSNLLEVERMKQEKKMWENKNIILEGELSQLKEKLQLITQELNSAMTNISSQETTINTLQNKLKHKEDKTEDVKNELTHFLESLAIITSTPTHFVEPQITTIKERVNQIVHEEKEKSLEVEDIKSKYMAQSQQYSYDYELRQQDRTRLKILDEEKSALESKLHKTESELTACELNKENLKRDKVIFVKFLDRLSRILNMDEISKEIGIELHTESILLRTEQLAKLESGKAIDKSAVVFQLQKRVKILKEQLQRRDLHLDLLRKKISSQEENSRVRTLLEAEKEEANLRAKKLQKQNDKLQLQLVEERATCRDLRSQLGESEEFKSKAIDRGHKIEELQKRLNESETLRIKYLEKLTSLREQLKVTSETSEQERVMNEHTIKLLNEELVKLKQNLDESQRSEQLLADLRRSVVTLLSLDNCSPDYEIVSKLSKLVNCHREYSLVTRRYNDPILSVSPHQYSSTESAGGFTSSRFQNLDNSRYYNSLLDDLETDINTSYNKRPTRNK